VRWSPRLMPLREGVVNWRGVFSRLRQIGYDGVLTFHSEYKGGASWRDLTTDELVEQTAEDLAYLKSVYDEVAG